MTVSTKRIEIGDTVTVHWEAHEPITGVVQYTPVATGDSWIIDVPAASRKKARVVYVQTFC